MLSFSISSCDLIKFPYFVNTTERGDRGQREGDFTITLRAQSVLRGPV